MTALLRCSLLGLLLSHFHQSAHAISNAGTNRVLMAYSAAFDICKEITDSSGHESKSAANKACEQAFQALDDIRLNICRGWRHAACRFIGGDEHYQCTCKISTCDDQAVRSNKVTAFRDCAPSLWTQELCMDTTLAPTADFQQRRSYYDSALQEALARRAYFGHHSGTGYSNGGSASGGAGTSSGLYDSGYCNTSAGYPSNIPGISHTVMPKPAVGLSDKYLKLHTCNECNGKYRSARALFDHKRAHHAVSDTHCYICDTPYKYRKSFLSHLRKRHPELAAQETAQQGLEADQADVEAIMPYPCSICPKRYSSRYGLLDHMKSHTTDETKCPVCGMILSTKGILKTHLQNFHPTAPIPERVRVGRRPTIREPVLGSESSRDFVCDECGKTYRYKKGLLAHSKSHKSEYTFCPLCKINLASYYCYKIHMQSIHPELTAAEAATRNAQYELEHPEKCTICEARFKNDRSLWDHMAVHKGQTTCDKCGAFFTRRSYLAGHKRKEHPK